MERTIISLTTIPERVTLLDAVIKSILTQSHIPDKIYIQVPKISRKNIPYDIPKIQEIIKNNNDNRIMINILETDEGPITKLYPVFDLEKDDNTNIILLDDDVVYGSNVIETLLDNKNLLAIGFAGRKYNNNTRLLDYTTHHSENYQQIDFLETYHGVLYKRKLFPKTSQEFIQWMKKLPGKDYIFADDIVIGRWLEIQNQPIYLLSNKNIQVTHDAKDSPQLRDLNLAGRNEKVYLEIRQSSTPIWKYIIIISIVLLILCMIYILIKKYKLNHNNILNGIKNIRTPL